MGLQITGLKLEIQEGSSLLIYLLNGYSIL